MMGLFNKKENGTKQNLPGQEPGEQKYFEVFGDTVTENLFLRNLVVLLLGLCIFLAIVAARTLNKPPLVIRVDQLGEAAAFSGVKQLTQVTGPEVRNFTEYFVKYLTAWDFYTYDDDLNKALGMATDNAKVRLKEYLDGIHVVDQIKANTLRTKLKISEIVVEKDTPQVVRVSVRGTREASSYENAEYKKETVFENTIIMQKVSRSIKTPWGLLVDDWTEKIFK